VNIDQSLGDHPRALRLNERYFYACLGLHVCAIGWCDRMRMDGFIPSAAVAKMKVGNIKPILDELLRTGFWEETDGGYTIHDYLDWNDSAEEIAAKTEAARASADRRWGKERDAKRTTSACETHAKRIAGGNAAQPSLAVPTEEERAARAQEFERLKGAYRGDGRWPEQAEPAFLALLEQGVPAEDIIAAAALTPTGHKQTLRFWLEDNVWRRYLPQSTKAPCPDADCVNGWVFIEGKDACIPCEICNRDAFERLKARA
jgi:hypothetical protein